MSPDTVIRDLIDTLAQAEAGLPAGSRFRPWLARPRRELLDLRAGARIDVAQVGWIETRLAELEREQTLRPLLAVPVSLAAWRLRRAASLARRTAVVVGRSGRDPDVSPYLTGLGRLLSAVADAVDADSGLRIRRDRTVPVRRAARSLRGHLAPG